ncbi:MAG: amidohydrolase [Ferruginibacter sp.]
MRMTNKAFILLAVILLSASTQAQTNMQVKQMAYADSSRLVEIFKDIHQNPELGFKETRTAGIIAKELKTLGYETITGIGKTGVAGILKNGSGPVVMYRADMDCNSVKEVTGLPYASTRTMKKEDGSETPVMHACGHDAHVSWLLGIAKIMMAIKNTWKGTLVLIGQPAEEPLTGAQAMVNDSMYFKGVPVPDYLIGMHTAAQYPVGQIENVPNVRQAGSDQLDVTFYGTGAHGSAPENSKDPIIMACNAILQYQTIISRNLSAQDVAVLTVGAIQSGSDNNVIPSSALVKLNLRWFDEKTRNKLLDGIKRINEGIAVANGLSQDRYPFIKMKGNVFPQFNDESFTSKISAGLKEIVGPENVTTNKPPHMFSEDFQNLVYGNNKTVCDYIAIGIANPSLYQKAIKDGKAAPFNHHAGDFQVDLAAIPLGVEIGTNVLLRTFTK